MCILILLFLFFILDAKQQVLANLANFAYDPINYEFIRKLHIIDLFLDEIDNTNENITEFAIGGLCNLCLGNHY